MEIRFGAKDRLPKAAILGLLLVGALAVPETISASPPTDNVSGIVLAQTGSPDSRLKARDSQQGALDPKHNTFDHERGPQPPLDLSTGSTDADHSPNQDHSPEPQLLKPTHQRSLLRILRSSHPLDFDENHWRSLGSDIEERLLEISVDRKEIYGARIRALHGLAQLKSEAGRQLTLDFADSESTPLPLRAAALETLARWWSPEDARPRALRLVESEEPLLRQSAEEALRLMDKP